MRQRNRGYVVTPQATAAAMRELMRRRGVQAAIDETGLTRIAVLAIGSEQVVQRATLDVAEETLARLSTEVPS